MEAELSASVTLRRSRLLVRAAGPNEGSEIVGAGFSCAYAIMSHEIASALFDNPEVCPRSARARLPKPEHAAFDKALAQSIDHNWLLLDGSDETETVAARAREDLLEAEVGTPNLWRATQRFYSSFVFELGLSMDDYVLDIGCGNLRIGVELVRYLRTGRYVGIDARQSVLDQGLELLAREGLSARNARLFLADNFTHPDLEGALFDFIVAFQLLYHLEDSNVVRFFNAAVCQLTPNGTLLANVQFAQDVADAKARGSWKGYPFIRRSEDEYRAMADSAGLSMEVLGRLDTLGYNDHAVGAQNHMLVFARKPQNR